MRGGWIKFLAVVLAILPVSVGRGDNTPIPADDLCRQLRPFVHLAVAAKSPLAMEHGAATLREVYAAFLSSIGRCDTCDDPEVRVRANDVLDKIILTIRLRRIEALLSPKLAKTFAEFRRAYPQMTEDIFSRDLQQQIQVLRQLEEQKDPRGLAEPILAICMKHPSEELRAWAIAAGVKKHYRSEMFVDALCDNIEREVKYRENIPYLMSNFMESDDSPPNVLEVACDAIRLIRPTQAGPRLLKLLDRQHEHSMYNRCYLAEVIGGLRDPSLIPPLLKRLRSSSVTNYMEDERGERVSFSPGDDALLALVRLTGQSPKQYKLFVNFDADDYSARLGFRKESERKQAYGKFKLWWKENCNRKEFQVPAPATQPAEKAKTVPATSESADLEIFPTPDDAEGLTQSVVAQTQRWIRDLADENYHHRTAASGGLVAMQDAILAEVLAGIRPASPNERRARLRLVEDMMISARIEKFRYCLPPETLAKMDALREKHPEAFRDFFSLSFRKRVEALETLSKDDKAGLAEPFIFSSLQTIDDEMTPKAVKILASGLYRSQKIRERLAGPISEEYLRDIEKQHIRFFFYGMGEAGPYRNWYKALGAVGGEQCLDVLMRLFKSDNWQVRFSLNDIVEAIVLVNDPRAVEMLMPYLNKTDMILEPPTANQGKAITCATSDFALMAMLRLTGQDPKTYSFRFTTLPYRRVKMYGFFDSKERTKAIARFRKWYKAQKTKKSQQAKNPPAMKHPTTEPAK